MYEDRVYVRLGMLCTLILTVPAAIVLLREARAALAARRARLPVVVGPEPSRADLRAIYDFTRAHPLM